MNGYLKVAAVALAAYAACALFQKQVMAIPVIGAFLPGATVDA